MSQEASDPPQDVHSPVPLVWTFLQLRNASRFLNCSGFTLTCFKLKAKISVFSTTEIRSQTAKRCGRQVCICEPRDKHRSSRGQSSRIQSPGSQIILWPCSGTAWGRNKLQLSVKTSTYWFLKERRHFTKLGQTNSKTNGCFPDVETLRWLPGPGTTTTLFPKHTAGHYSDTSSNWEHPGVKENVP